eukprot:5338999-Prymnesium_polylepis.1
MAEPEEGGTRERGRSARSEEGPRSEEHREAKGREADQKPEGHTKGRGARSSEEAAPERAPSKSQSAENASADC